MNQQYYEVLGVSINSSKNDIKIAYRQLAKKYHPDLNNAPDAREKFIEIQKAYEKIINLPSGIPSIDDVFQQVFSKENQERRRRERQRPKPISDVLNHLIEDIDQYCREILDQYFIETNPKYKETLKDWNNDFEGIKEIKKEIYKKAWSYDLEDDGTCMGDSDNCPRTEEMGEEEGRKLCKKCFEECKEGWHNSYKRSIDIGFAYLRAYLEASPKYHKPLRKEYNSKKVKVTTVIDGKKPITEDYKKEKETGTLNPWL